MAKRRGHNEGSISQRHDHPTCPPLIDGERAEHRCQGRWVAMVNLGYVDGKRRRRAIYADTRKGAAIKLQEALAARNSKSLVVGQVTVETWLRYWLEVICPERGLKVNTMKSHKSKVEQYLIPHLGHHRVDRLEPEHIRAMYAAMRRKGLSESTLSQTHAVLRRALEVAVRERKASRNAATMLDRPQPDRTGRHGLSLTDARKVLAAAGDDPRWFLALYLGLRQGEALALRWSDIDLDGGTLAVQRSLSRQPGVGLVFDRPKSATSVRVLPLLTVVRSRLEVRWAQHVAAGGTRADLVFTSPTGGPVDPRRDWQAWSDLLKRSGVEHVALHAARNTTASLLEAAGVGARIAAQILGHSHVDMTHHYQQYADVELLAGALGALEQHLAIE